jgi:hypothetical protein
MHGFSVVQKTNNPLVCMHARQPASTCMLVVLNYLFQYILGKLYMVSCFDVALSEAGLHVYSAKSSKTED